MPLATASLDYLRDVISRKSGNVVSSTQSYLVESRLGPLAESLGLRNVEGLVAELQRANSAPLQDRVAEAMTINETSFFRDNQPFEAMKAVVLPRLIAARQRDRKLSVWSGACSSGQEPYSLAMLLRDGFPEMADWKLSILATDLSEEMLRRTREGKYTQFEVNRGLPARLLARYFVRQGLQWQVQPELREIVTCRKLNLTAIDAVFPKFDVIFLRNVLIYFDQPCKESILRQIHRCLAPDGCLFLGGGEALVNLNVPFQREPVGQTCCFRPL